MLATETTTEKKIRLNIKVDTHMHRRLRVDAAKSGMTSQDFVTRLLDEHLAPLREEETVK